MVPRSSADASSVSRWQLVRYAGLRVPDANDHAVHQQQARDRDRLRRNGRRHVSGFGRFDAGSRGRQHDGLRSSCRISVDTPIVARRKSVATSHSPVGARRARTRVASMTASGEERGNQVPVSTVRPLRRLVKAPRDASDEGRFGMVQV